MSEARRRLTDIKFEHEGAHVALVGKHQGGPANGITTLVYKALDVSQELVDKAGEVTVTLPFNEFLRKFFGMYWEDSNVLAQALGFEAESEQPADYKEYIDSKVAAISILKNVYKAQDIPKALGELSPEESLSILIAQEVLEKAMSSALPEGDITITSHYNEDVNMETIQKALHDELVAKAVAVAEDVLKAQLQVQTDVLKAVQDELEVLKALQVAGVVKSRKEALVAAHVAADEVEDLFKAVGELPQEAFELVVKQLANKAALADASDLFKETGVPGAGEQDPVIKDAVADILKAKYPTK